MNKQIFDYSVDLIQALLWQHNEAPRITALLRLKNAWYTANLSNFWETWLHDVFDMRTANTFGLKVWSLILGIPLNTVANPNNPDIFGFDEFNLNYDQGYFGLSNNNSVVVPIEHARILLRLRYFNITCRPTIPEINEFLRDVFPNPEGVWVIDSNDMTWITYSFGWNPGEPLIELLYYYDVLPRPAAVGVRIAVKMPQFFGFDKYRETFNQAPYAPEGMAAP